MKILELVLLFWFGNIEKIDDFPLERFEFWFSASENLDREIKEKFKSAIDDAASGKFDKLKDDPKALLAMIILLDQFSRNIYRNHPKFISFDQMALELAKEGVRKGLDKNLPYIYRMFFYLPYEHSEDLKTQEESVKLFEGLVHDAPNHLKEVLKEPLRYAYDHYEIIKRFGRFPHRNKILGRESTEEELELLKRGGSFF